MSCDEKTIKAIEAGLELPIITEEEAERVYKHSSLKWQWKKPYSKLSEEQKGALRKVARNMKKKNNPEPEE